MKYNNLEGILRANFVALWVDRFMGAGQFNIADTKNESEIQDAVDWLEKVYQVDEQILEEFISLRKIL